MLIRSKSLLLSCEVKWCQGLACKTAHLSALISAALKLQKAMKEKGGFLPITSWLICVLLLANAGVQGYDSRLNDALYVCRRLAAQAIVPRLFKHRGKGGAMALRANIKMPYPATLTGYFRGAGSQSCSFVGERPNMHGHKVSSETWWALAPSKQFDCKFHTVGACAKIRRISLSCSKYPRSVGMILWDNGTCLRFQTDWHSIMQMRGSGDGNVKWRTSLARAKTHRLSKL